MDIRYRIIDSAGKKVFCNLNDKEIDKIKNINSTSEKVGVGNLRAGMISNNHGTVFACSSNKNYVNSSKKFNTAIKVISNSVEMMNKILEDANDSINKSTSRLIHNLTSLNAHNIQEIYSLIPQEKISKKMSGQVAFVENIVKSTPKETALVLLRIAKNNAAMKAEFSVFRKLFDTNPALQIREHNVHKVLMNIFYLFFPDFTDKEVKVLVGDDKNKYIASFDYESFHVALYHIIENAAKYVKPKTNFDVVIKDGDGFIEIIMDMVSLQIKEDEKDRIFEEGVSGELAHCIGKSGDGIGMSRAKKILELSAGEVTVVPYKDTSVITMGITYQRNVFTIKLPKRKQA